MTAQTKKTYCYRCKKLVRVHLTNGDYTASVQCNSCNTALYQWDGATWRRISVKQREP